MIPFALLSSAVKFIKASPNLMLGLAVSIAVILSYCLGRTSKEADDLTDALENYQAEIIRLNDIAQQLNNALHLNEQITKTNLLNYDEVIAKIPIARDCGSIPTDRLSVIKNATNQANATLRINRTLPNNSPVKK